MDAADLIRRARAGDQAALGELLAAERGRLVQLAETGLDPRVKARLDASDVVQQTCLSAFRQIADFRGDDLAQFGAWLRQVHERNIQNAIRHQLQTQKRSAGREEHLDGQDFHAVGQATPSQQAMEREETARLDAALVQLPADEAAVLRLRYLKGCTLSEAAERLGQSKEATVWLMQKGMKRVRRLLDGL